MASSYQVDGCAVRSPRLLDQSTAVGVPRASVYNGNKTGRIDNSSNDALLPGGDAAPASSEPTTRIDDKEPVGIRDKNGAVARTSNNNSSNERRSSIQLAKNSLIQQLICYLQVINIALGASCLKYTTGKALTLDYIIEALTKCHQRDLTRAQLLQRIRTPDFSGYKLCPQLKHYKQSNPRQRGLGQLSEAQVLTFADRQFNTSHLPDGIPSEMSDMKLEVNRLKSFSVPGKRAFVEFCRTGQQPEVLAACGFFYTQESDRVKCAFCLGVLYNWDEGESPDEAHRIRYSTCPLLLGLSVGNVPIARQPDKTLSEPHQCSEDNSSCVSSSGDLKAFWTVATVDAELQHQFPLLTAASELAQRPGSFPVSAAAAAAACRPNAAANLEMLGRSLHSRDVAARYHPMKHPSWQDAGLRAESMARSSQLMVPTDLLASAGFFLDDGLRTTCYWCGLRVVQWTPADDPWVEHARWSPRCCHLLLELGHEFVTAARASHPPYLHPHQQLPAPARSGGGGGAASAGKDADDEASTGFVASIGGPLIDYRVEPRHFKAREDFPTSLAVARLGCDPDDVRTAQFLQLKGSGEDFRSGELFLASALAQAAKRTQLGLGGREFYEKTQQEQDQLLARQPKPFEGDELDWRACKVCMDKVINVTLLDCKHLCCCSDCARHLDTCPLCRAPIRATMLVNMD